MTSLCRASPVHYLQPCCPSSALHLFVTSPMPVIELKTWQPCCLCHLPYPFLALPPLSVYPVTVLMPSCSGPHVPSTRCVRMEIFCFLVHTLLGTFHSRSSQFAHSFTGAHTVDVVDRAVIRRCTRTGKDHKGKEEEDSENV